jgi:MFS family permease
MNIVSVSSPSVWERIASGGAALRHRNFRLFFFGQLVSLSGSWMQTMAQQWLVYTLSTPAQAAFQLGLVSTFQFLPVLLFSLHAGVIVERFPKRRMIIITQVAFLVLATILGLLVLTRTVQIWHVYIIAALFGVVNAFDVPSRQAFMVEMVGKEDLLNGIALNSSLFNMSRVVGPAIATQLIGHVGIAACFLLNAVSFVPVIIGLFMMRVASRPLIAARQVGTLRSIREGVDYIREHERLWLVFAIVCVVNVLGVPMYVTLLPIFATQILHANVDGLGMMNVALGLGATVGALLLAYLPSGPARSRILLASSVGISMLLIAFGCSSSLALSTVLLTAIGFCIVSINSAGNAIIQEVTPDHLRGRVMSVWGLVLIGMTPIGSFLAGILAQHLGAPLAVATGATGCLIAAISANIRAQKHHAMIEMIMPEPEPLLGEVLD